MRKLHFSNIKANKGITLVALIVTIIILLILAGVTIIQLTGNGLFENAKLAKEKHENAQELENTILAGYEGEIGEYVDGTRETVTISKDDYEKLVNKVNNIGKMYTTSEFITNEIPAREGIKLMKLTLEPGKYIISGKLYKDDGSNLDTEANSYITLDGDWFWADEGHASCFRGTGTIIREITETRDVYLGVWSCVSFSITHGNLTAIRISD